MCRWAIFPFAVCVAVNVAPSSASAQESKLASLRERARLEAHNVEITLEYAHALRLAGREEQALAALRQAESAAAGGGHGAASLASIRLETARTYMQLGDFRHAFATCQTIAPLQGGVARSHSCGAEAHMVWMRGGEALSEVRSALASGEAIPEAKVVEGRADELALEDAAAEEAYRTAISWSPDDPSGHAALGLLLARTARREEGLTELRSALALEPGNAQLLVALGREVAPDPEARQLFEKATRERPTWAEAWTLAAGRELDAGDLAAAKLSALSAVKLAPKDAAPRVVLGRVALASGDARTAREEGQKALSLLANSADARLLVADAEAVLGDVDAALVGYESAWGLDHSKETALLRAAKLCLTAGRATSSRAFAQKATDAFAQHGASWIALGDALLAEKDRAGAKAAYERALQADAKVDRAAVQNKLDSLR